MNQGVSGVAEKLAFTKHAADRLKERIVDRSEIEYALENASIQVPGKNPGTTRVICDMPLGRKLSIVYKDKPGGIRLIITVFWIEGQP